MKEILKPIFDALTKPWPEECEVTDPVTGMTYIPGQLKIERLNEVFGHGNWKTISEGEPKLYRSGDHGQEWFLVRGHVEAYIHIGGEVLVLSTSVQSGAWPVSDPNEYGNAIKACVSDLRSKCLQEWGVAGYLWEKNKTVESPNNPPAMDRVAKRTTADAVDYAKLQEEKKKRREEPETKVIQYKTAPVPPEPNYETEHSPEQSEQEESLFPDDLPGQPDPKEEMEEREVPEELPSSEEQDSEPTYAKVLEIESREDKLEYLLKHFDVTDEEIKSALEIKRLHANRIDEYVTEYLLKGDRKEVLADAPEEAEDKEEDQEEFDGENNSDSKFFLEEERQLSGEGGAIEVYQKLNSVGVTEGNYPAIVERSEIPVVDGFSNTLENFARRANGETIDTLIGVVEKMK